MKKHTRPYKGNQSMEQFFEQAGIHPSVDNAAIRAIAYLFRVRIGGRQKG